VKLKDASGSTVRWLPTFDQAKTYTLLIGYANGAEFDASLDLVVNATTISLTLPPSGAWTNRQTMALEVTLREGRNRLQVKTRAPEGVYIDDLEFYDETTNLLSAGISVSGSAEQPDHPAGNATDGSFGTVWQAAGFPQRVQVDLGRDYVINKAVLVGLNDQVYQYQVQIGACPCDQFTTIVDKTDNQTPCSLAASYIDRFAPVSARCIRLIITGGGGSQETGISIREFGVCKAPEPL